ncbi:MAG TPA: dienelactone hydrolase family protein [Geminicoccaceae bacterium]|nr:dienelactone hydrolase family protein [Geminicoccaceae bacterium]
MIRETALIGAKHIRRRVSAPPRRAALRLLAALLAAASLSGCAARVHTPFLPGYAPDRAPLVRIAASEFDYALDRRYPRYPITGEEPHYWIRPVAIPSVGENGQAGDLVTARYYQGKRAGAKPLVIVLPIWGIHEYPSSTISAGLRERGAGAINVLQILGERPLFDWDALDDVESEAEFFAMLDRMIDRFVATVVDIRRLVDWAETRPDIDRERIGLIGFSMSALVASVTIAHEPRLAAGVLVMGGADPHEILAACNREIEDARERIRAQLGWSLERFRRELEQALAGINPARFAGMTDPSRVLIIEAGADTCVPRSARERLWHAMGRPERIAYSYDHRMAFLAMTFLGGYNLQRQVYRFLDRTLARRGDRYLFQANRAPARGADPG